ncbi:MAG: Sua5/YciO/YrdC/YwlC family protein, partial [Bacilli bacterium]|nr:Sua5/YciO/YrdC/YwlC family protein [Bacilli bacterium]
MKVVSIFEFDDMVKAIQNEEVIGFPTETVYGLGVVYDSEKAFEKLQIVKNRPPLKPFTLMCGD